MSSVEGYVLQQQVATVTGNFSEVATVMRKEDAALDTDTHTQGETR